MTRRPPYLLVLAFAALALAPLLESMARLPVQSLRDSDSAPLAPLLLWGLANALLVGGALLLVAGAAEVASTSTGWRRSLARAATAAFAVSLAVSLWTSVRPRALGDHTLQWTLALLALAGTTGATSAAIAPGRAWAFAAVAVVAAIKIAALPAIDLWSRWGWGSMTWFVVPAVVGAVAGIVAVVGGAPARVTTSARPAWRGLRFARGALGLRIAVGLVGGAMAAIAFAMRDPGVLGDGVLYGLPFAMLAVQVALLIAIAWTARTVGPDAPARRLAAAALLVAIAAGLDLRLLEFTLGSRALGQVGLVEMRAIAWIAPACAALGLILFASATAQLARAAANLPMARTPIGTVLLLAGGACLAPLFFHEAVKSMLDPQIPTTLSVLAAAMGLIAAVTAGILRGEVATTERALSAVLERTPEVPAAIAKLS